MVAADRLYSEEHFWVKTLGPDRAVVGISDQLQLTIIPTKLILPDAGQSFNSGDAMGSLEGQKLMIDMIAPISGSILQINTFLYEQENPEGIHSIVDDPYGQGWLVVMQIHKPAELQGLLTPQQYVAYTAESG